MHMITIPGAAFAPADAANGAAPGNATPVRSGFDAEEMKRRAGIARDISASFGQLVSLMMRSHQHRLTMLTELEWMIMPAIATRQFRVAEGFAQDKGLVAPVAAVLWASVNADVDKRFSDNLDIPMKLKPEEWRSGEHVWIIETFGDPKAISAMLQHLKQTELKDRKVRMRVRGQDGKVAVGRVELQPEQVAKTA